MTAQEVQSWLGLTQGEPVFSAWLLWQICLSSHQTLPYFSSHLRPSQCMFLSGAWGDRVFKIFLPSSSTWWIQNNGARLFLEAHGGRTVVAWESPLWYKEKGCVAYFIFLLSWVWSNTGPGTERGCGIFIIGDNWNWTGQDLTLVSLSLLGVGIAVNDLQVPQLTFLILSKCIIILGEEHVSCLNLSLCSGLVSCQAYTSESCSYLQHLNYTVLTLSRCSAVLLS